MPILLPKDHEGENMKTSESLLKIAPALLAAQKKIGGAHKGATNPFFKSKYADLGAVMEACKEALNESKITVLQPIGTDEQGVYVETLLLHSSGEYISDRMLIAAKSANNPQDQGSAITYARRYSLQSMVFIPSEDDDGQRAASQAVAKPVVKTRDDGYTAEPVEGQEQQEKMDILFCETCGEPAEEKSGLGVKSKKPFHGIFCSTKEFSHTKWLKK